MKKADLVSAVAHDTGLGKQQAIDAVESTLARIAGGLARGERVQLVGFGTFLVTRREARMGRNPQTGQAMRIAASNNVRFRAGKALKDAVNG